MTLEQEIKVQRFMLGAYEMAQSEDWDESCAQEFIMELSELYEQMYLTKQ
jgi:hypothetical protein